MISSHSLRLRVALAALGLFAPAPAIVAVEAPKPAYAQVTDVLGLPRVLLLGDSISIGYTLPVREKLARQANVHRPPQNCGSTAHGLAELDKWLGMGRWDVIHFNFGLHDLKYLDTSGGLTDPASGRQVAPPAQYESNLRALVARLKNTGATLIFATTTPVPANCSGRIEHDEQPYNAIARRVMKESGVTLNDLHAEAQRHQRVWQRPANVHFTEEGSNHLAELVAASILAQLQAGTSR